MKLLREMHGGVHGLDNFDRAVDMINAAVEHHERNDNFDAIADIDSLVQFLKGQHHDFTPALEQTVRDIIADEIGSDSDMWEEEEVRKPRTRIKSKPSPKGSREGPEPIADYCRECGGTGTEDGSQFTGKCRVCDGSGHVGGWGARNAHQKASRKWHFGEEQEEKKDPWTTSKLQNRGMKTFYKPKRAKRNRRDTFKKPASRYKSTLTKASRGEEEENVVSMGERRARSFGAKRGTYRTGRDLPNDLNRMRGYRHRDRNRARAQQFAKKARPHVKSEEREWERDFDPRVPSQETDWNKEVSDFRKRRKTYEPKFARGHSRLMKRRKQSGPTSGVFGVRFESFKQFNEMYRDSQHGLTIDLSGPEGNAFALLGYAKGLARQLDKDWKKIQEDMTYSDYDHLVDVFEREFGSVVTLINRPGEDMARMKDREQSDRREPVESGNVRTPPRGGYKG
jgi:hypothetical protein